MNDAPEPKREPTAAAYLHLPMPIVAGTLFVLLVGLLGLGLYANRNLRPQGIVVPTPVTQTALSETQVPVAAAATPSPTTAAAVATTAPTPLILIAETPTSSAPAPTLAPSATPALPAVSESPTTLPTVEPTLAAVVGKSYEDYWRVRSRALLDLDATHLAEVMDGEYLMTFQTNLESLRASGRAIKTQVSLHYKVIQAKQSSAVVVDRVADDSIYVIPGTDTPLSDPANDVLSLETKLQNFEGTWKVVEIVSAD